MKRLSMFLMCLLALMAASQSAKAQEVTITLWPGWNWISYPNAEVLDVATALGDFVPVDGDIIKSQFSNSTYSRGNWRGGVTHFMPGWGYKYYSNRDEMVSFVFSLPPMPTGTLTVTTGELANITSTTAACGGSAVSNDGTSILMKGVCWATHPQPTTNDSYTEDGSGPGAFTADMTELAQETEYYVRAYAISVKGINYGEELSFTTAPQGILNGLFSVSENTQVYFSQGNLQYQASTNTWRFAENQWDYVGEGNANASPTYDGWIDLFAWATSGYDHATDGYQPWSEGCNAYDVDFLNLCDRTGKADWGYNAISNGGNEERLWRTCTGSEWGYLMFDRQTASGIRFAKATIGETNGIIMLPDNWSAALYSLNNVNQGEAPYDGNVISLEVWMSVFEANGAVFLPASGRIQDWAENDYNQCGMYWNSSDVYGYLKGLLSFGGDSMGLGSYYTDEHYSVRLVRSPQGATYSIEAVPNPADAGTVEGSGIYDYYTAANLTAIPNEGYTFICWKENGRVVSTDNTYEVLALFNRNLEACFFENSTYPLTYSYNEEDHTATVTGHWDGVELTGELVIPETVMHNGEAYTVTAIGDNALMDCSNLTSVEFPNSLVSIGQSACEVCRNLTSITIPNSVTSIGSWAFSHCNSITEITIPNSVSHIGINPFHDCTNLAQITVELGNLYYDSRNNCNAIIETSSNSLISGSLNTVIPNSVTAICRDAFLQIPITTVSIPASVVRMDMSAFALTSLSEITIYAEIPPILNDGPFNGVDKSIPVYVPCGSIEAYQIASGWNEFTNFIGVGQCSGIVTVTASSEEYGTVSGGGSFEGGETCTVTATPNEGYYFLCWMEDGQGVSTEATYTFPIYRDHNLTAIFYATLGDENIINGDFEQGNVGFTSGYYYNYDIGQGDYYVDDNPHGWEGFGHGGSGNFMLIDAATEPGINVWTEQIPVEPNTYYTFSSWACTLYPESWAVLQFSVNGTSIGVLTAPSQTNTWKQFRAVWYSGNSTMATITVVDLNTEGSGNDFGLDDISFRELDPSVNSGRGSMR